MMEPTAFKIAKSSNAELRCMIGFVIKDVMKFTLPQRCNDGYGNRYEFIHV